MALPYNVWTDEQIKYRNIVQDGNYVFEILSAIQKPTKQKFDANGTPQPIHQMLELELKFNDQNGMPKTHKDWIVFAEGMDWKFKHLAASIGLSDLYNAQQLDAYHLRGKRGVFTLGTKESIYNGEQRRQNFVKDYIVGDVQPSATPAPLQDKNGFDSELSF